MLGIPLNFTATKWAAHAPYAATAEIAASICAAIRKDDEAGEWFRFCNDSIDLRFDGLSYLLARRAGNRREHAAKRHPFQSLRIVNVVSNTRGRESIVAHFGSFPEPAPAGHLLGSGDCLRR